MFDKKYEDRLRSWVNLRQELEICHDPFKKVVDFYNQAPLASLSVDPYDESYWPDPWTLLYHNDYCEFAIILAIAYTLKLTTRFKDNKIEIHICTDRENSEIKYLLFVDEIVLGYDRENPINRDNLPQDLTVDKKYCL